MDLKRIAREIFTRTLTKVRPDEMIPDRIIYSPEERKMTIHDQTFQLEKGQPLYIIGTGKAAATMALAAEKLFKEDIKGGYIIIDRKSTRLNSSHVASSYAVFCLKKKNK